jgi:hypothetical protein
LSQRLTREGPTLSVAASVLAAVAPSFLKAARTRPFLLVGSSVMLVPVYYGMRFDHHMNGYFAVPKDVGQTGLDRTLKSTGERLKKFFPHVIGFLSPIEQSHQWYHAQDTRRGLAAPFRLQSWLFGR